jgi:hypothetical protein
MRLRCLFGLSLLISSGAGQALAQGAMPQGKGLFSSTPLAGAPVFAQDSRGRTPALSLNALGEAQGGQAEPSFKLNGTIAFGATPGTLLRGAKPNAFHPQTPWLIANLAIAKSQMLARNQRPCYAIRSYQFAQDEPGSDATRATGYSTCMAGAEIRLKGAADPGGALPR